MPTDALWETLKDVKLKLTGLTPKVQGRNYKVLHAALGEVEAIRLDSLAVALDAQGNTAESQQSRARANILHARFEAETEGIE